MTDECAGRCVVVADDDPSILKLVELAFKLDGWHVHSHANGASAWAELEANPPDAYQLVLIDLMMPEMNGLELLGRIRAHERLMELPVVIITAKGSREDVAVGHAHGCDAYVVKPYDPNDLVAVAWEMIELGPELRAARREQRLDA